MLKYIFSILSLFSFLTVNAELPDYDIITSATPVSSYGNITRLAVNSGNLGAVVVVDIWTPDEYDPMSDKSYPVIYFHDGQNLFDASFTFAGVPWGVDKACDLLATDENFVMPIVVGINNRGSEGLRPSDYFPEEALKYISPDQMNSTYIYETCNNVFFGNEHAAFVANELKPLVDSLYKTEPGRSNTFAIGSSMGGLASLYLMCEYPEIFGGAACLSTHWIGSLSLNPDYTLNDDEVCANAILQYLSECIPTDGMHRLYLDQGTKDWDADYLKYETIAREIVRGKGYSDENNSLYLYDAVGSGHNEWYWQQRVHIPLKFVLSKDAMESSGIRTVESGEDGTDTGNLIFDLAGRSHILQDFDNLPA